MAFVAFSSLPLRLATYAAMTHLTDGELARIATGLESDRFERRRSLDTRALRRNICAFANDLPGHGDAGLYLIGVEHDGRRSDIVINDELLRAIASAGNDGNFLPTPSFVVEKRRFADGEVAAVFVEPALYPPVRYRGRVWVRVGPTVRQATPDDERRLGERGASRDLSFDRRPCPGATPADLDARFLREHYLPYAATGDAGAENAPPFEARLRSLRLLAPRDPSPTWGALLAFARDPLEWLPGARVEFVTIQGRERSDPVRFQKTISGRISEVLRDLERLIRLSIQVATQIAGVELEVRRPDYPAAALQELVRNAVTHRSYESNLPVRVYWYSDRVEILSPGGLCGIVSEEGFGDSATDYRNPLVSEIMENLDLARRLGVGIPLARRTLEDNGNPPPEFTFSPASVRATVRTTR